MMKLLTILCCRHPRVTLSTLLRCEQALARVDFESYIQSSNQLAALVKIHFAGVEMEIIE